jgi:predicted helicase
LSVGTLNGLLGTLESDPVRRGKQFEHICKWFLTNAAVYRQRLRRVWLWDEWPSRWGIDAGIDLAAEEQGGRLWAIQTKAYDPAYSIMKADVATFLSESGRPEFAFRLLIATTDRIGKTAERTLRAQEKPAGCLLRGDLDAAQVSWPQSAADLRTVVPEPKRPRPHQREAIAAVIRGFETADRGQMIMACGTGKTLTALFIAEQLAVRRALVLVPSLALLTDTLREWTVNASRTFDFLPVCSDDTVTGYDDAVSTTADFGFPVTTDPLEIVAFLAHDVGPRVVFATYQSSPRIADAFRLGHLPAFDLVIADEAHRCAGPVSSDFATVLDPEAVPARRRLFITATPRIFTKRIKTAAREGDFEVASMDDEAHFGKVFHRLGFAEAIERELLTDYQVAIVGVDDATYLEWTQRGRFVTIDGSVITDARAIAGQIGLVKAIRRFDLRRVISFHSRVGWAREFANAISQLIAWMPVDQQPTGRLWTDYASGEMSAGDRSRRLDHLRHLDEEESGLLSNARCLGEGVDVPALDGVAFIDPRRSEVDIVQAVGRAIRLTADRKIGTIVIPVFIEPGEDAELALAGSAFKPVWEVVKALRAHDDLLGKELDELRRERGREKKALKLPAKIILDLPERIGVDFADAFDVHLVDETTASWEFFFGLLLSFVERENHAFVPQFHIENGFKLGVWVGHQRTEFGRGDLAQERIARLEALPGWEWDAFAAKWEEGFGCLLRFAQREHHARVPRHHMEGDYPLGSWVNSQRTFYRKKWLAPERIARLEAIDGWAWVERTSKWDEGINSLQHFIDSHGDSRVPKGFIDEDRVRLGQWVSNRRSHYRKGVQLTPERIAQLEAIPGWSWVPSSQQGSD